MPQWLMAMIAAGLAIIVLPLSISSMKERYRRKPRSGAGQGIDAAFAVFDPAKARQLQMGEVRKEISHADEGDQGELLKPVPPPPDHYSPDRS